jgi:hypothetical protein
MAPYEVTVTPLDSRTPVLTQVVEINLDWRGHEWNEDGRPPTDMEIAIEVLKRVDGAECPYDCDTCRED